MNVMNATTTVWLIRHAATESMDGRCYGWHDVPLSQTGVDQAENLAQQLARSQLDAMYASPLRRALETARILAKPHDASVETIQGLAEIHFGDFEGLSYDEIQKRFPEIYQQWMHQPTAVRFPNGEDFQRFQRRALATLHSIVARHAGKSIAVVTHAGVVRILLADALGIPDSHIFRLAQDYAAVNRIDYDDYGATVKFVNGYKEEAYL
jgi:alpha-ribazole phosphatase